MLDLCTLKQFALKDFISMHPLLWSSSYQQTGLTNTVVTFASNATRTTISLNKTLAALPLVGRFCFFMIGNSSFSWWCEWPNWLWFPLVASITVLINFLHTWRINQLCPPLICKCSRLLTENFAPVGRIKASFSKYSLPDMLPLGLRPHAKYKTTSVPSTKAVLLQLWNIARHWIQLP